MKFACSTWMVPGNSFAEKIENSVRYGFDGVEIRLFEKEASRQKIHEIRTALEICHSNAVSLIMPGETYRMPLLDQKILDDKVALAKKAIAAAAEFGCPTIVCPEYGAQTPLPLFDHPRRPGEKLHRLLITYLRTVADYAEQCGTQVMIEPINRYETRFFYTLEDGRKVIDETESKALFLLADFFHMNIEESDPWRAIRESCGYIRHVHLGDSNRGLPGSGHTDFTEGFRALLDNDYSYYAALECGVGENPEETLPRCAAYLKECADKAGQEKEG